MPNTSIKSTRYAQKKKKNNSQHIRGGFTHHISLLGLFQSSTNGSVHVF